MKKLLLSLAVVIAFAGVATPALAKAPNNNLGGLDLNAYCQHVGLSNDSHVKPGTQNWYCTAKNNDAKNHISIGEACEWQYQKPFGGISREVVPGNPYTYNCFESLRVENK